MYGSKVNGGTRREYWNYGWTGPGVVVDVGASETGCPVTVVRRGVLSLRGTTDKLQRSLVTIQSSFTFVVS